MMGSHVARVAAVCVAVLLVAAGCGDDDDGGLFDGSTSQATATTSSGPTTTDAGEDPTTTAGPATTDAGEGPATTSGGSDITTGDDDIDALLERFRAEPLRLTYELGDGGADGTMILAQDPTADPPVASYTFVEDGGRVIQRPGEMIICDQAGGCFTVPAVGGEEMLLAMFGGGAAGAWMLAAGAGDTPGYDVESEGVSIAGRDGVCITLTPNQAFDPDVEYLRQCVDAEIGFVLLMETRDQGADSPEQAMRLLEYALPTPDDFEPTGPVQDMPGG
jgi:hypothetical protein